MVDIPEELLLDILSWLPVESLVRFKCVCKSWYNMLESPKFVSRHMAKQSNDYVILMHLGIGKFIYFLSNICYDADVVSSIDDSELNLQCRSHEGCSNHRVMCGYCDGVILLSDQNDVLILCNPTIREVRIVPTSPFFRGYMSGRDPHPPITYTVGFGDDPKTKDYKIVRVLFIGAREDPSSNEDGVKAEVYSLSADSWREVKGNAGSYLNYSEFHLGEQYFDGVYYWCGNYVETEKTVLISFDMADEEFKRSPIPDVVDNAGNYLYLGVFKNESIALFVRPPLQAEQFFDVWVMKEFGIKESWTKQLTIGPLLGLGRPLLFWKNDKELLQEDWDGYLFSYDLASLNSRPIEPLRGLDLWRAFSYKKTLVPVARRVYI